MVARLPYGCRVAAISDWLGTLPPVVLYLMVALVIGVESMGVPLPGEIALVTASVLAAGGHANIWWVAIAGSLGAIVGDSCGYLIGKRGGRALLERLGRRFPRHLGPEHLARAEHAFDRWGVWAIFFGRFIALLRIAAGPLAGALRVPYLRFLVANATGGIVWAGGTATVIYILGKAAERWLQRFSWVALVVAIAAGIASTLVMRARARRASRANDADPDNEPEPSGRRA
jgi:membrane protein DedA with SNARE-associated domain